MLPSRVANRHVPFRLRRRVIFVTVRRGQPMDPILLEFLRLFQGSYRPPSPSRGKSGKEWWVSNVWTEYTKEWMRRHYWVETEYRLSGRRRMDAALWSKTDRQDTRPEKMDIAVEWQWDNNQICDLLTVDFPKCLEVDAQCGLIIVQTRADRTRGSTQADETVRGLFHRCKECRRDSRSVALIEIRRILHRKERVEFLVNFQDLDTTANQEIGGWSYPQ